MFLKRSALTINLIFLPATAVITIIYFGIAPRYLTLGFPALFFILSFLRIFLWKYRNADANKVLPEQQQAQMRVSLIYIAARLVTMGLWVAVLAEYGDENMRLVAVGQVALTIPAIVFVMTAISERAAALAAAANIFVVILLLAPKPDLAVAVTLANMVGVATATMQMARSHHRTIGKMHDALSDLESRGNQLLALSDANAVLANHDSLTDLPNRRLFFRRLEKALETAKRENLRFSIALLDLDGFKVVNDLHGHLAGDEVLQEAARRIKMVVGDAVLVARLGGDEFALILQSSLTVQEILGLGDAVTSALGRPYDLPGGIVAHLLCSCGIAMYPETSRDVRGLVARADYALYHSKAVGCGISEIFSPSDEEDIRSRAKITQALLGADLTEEFTLLYQPIVDASTGQAIAVEALARWTSPTLGSVPPDVFIQAAEKMHLINRLTQILLEKALVDMAKWPSTVGLSFNLSTHDLGSSDAVLQLAAIIDRSGILPHRITFEITETAFMQNVDVARANMSALRSLGVSIALDDFGTGFSSLAYVHRLPIDKIKIDRSFVRNIEDDQASRDIVKTIIDMCANLQIHSIGEGVETVEQCRIMQLFGCQAFQGYYFGRPVPSCEITNLTGLHSEGPELAFALGA